MNYFLLLHNHSPIVIHQGDRKKYYYALNHFDRAGTLEAMMVFLKGQTAKTWEQVMKRYEFPRK